MIYNVTIEVLNRFCVFDLKGTQSCVASRLGRLPIIPPERPNTATTAGDLALCWVGPEQWILRASVDSEHALRFEFQTDDNHNKTSVVEISDMLQFFSVGGRDAEDVLAVCSPLDTHLTAFPDNAATFTELLGTKALLLRVTNGYHLAVERSYADFIDDNLHRILGISLPVNHAGRAPFSSGVIDDSVD